MVRKPRPPCESPPLRNLNHNHSLNHSLSHSLSHSLNHSLNHNHNHSLNLKLPMGMEAMAILAVAPMVAAPESQAAPWLFRPVGSVPPSSRSA